MQNRKKGTAFKMKIYKATEIDELVNILNNDGVIAVPTDTVYGLCAKMSSKNAYLKLINIKNRPKNKAFPIMCANFEQISSIAQIDKKSEKIIKRFMPGPITILLEKKLNIPDYVNNGLKLIAIRMATSKTLEELIKMVETPVFMTSANISGEPVCKSIEEIEKTFPNIEGILEGEVSFGQASTIVDCTSDEIKIIREGPITLEEILNVVNDNVCK